MSTARRGYRRKKAVSQARESGGSMAADVESGVFPAERQPGADKTATNAGLIKRGGLTMNVKIQTVKFDADQKLIEFINAKMNKLDRFADRSIGSEVTLKLDKDNERGNKVATIRLEVPGDDLVAEYRSKSFEESVDGAIDALKKQIERHKERFNK